MDSMRAPSSHEPALPRSAVSDMTQEENRGQAPPEIGAPAKRGIAWVLSSNVVIQGFQFAVGILLARLLDPADFGVLAVTSIFTGLAANIANTLATNILSAAFHIKRIA